MNNLKVTRTGVNEFYDSGQGDRLVDASCYPLEIVHFLHEEQRLLNLLADSIDLLVEVGCMEGRYLDWAFANDKMYLGIDIVQRYIEAGKTRLKTGRFPAFSYRMRIGDAEEISTLLKAEGFEYSNTRALLFFPFNSFGNMSSAERVIENLADANLPFVISTYGTSTDANACRHTYYKSCEYKDITMNANDDGVRFFSPDGLNTIAYSSTYMQVLFNRYKLTVQRLPFSCIGIAYMREDMAVKLSSYRWIGESS
jgi:hypothetical protein